jgi:hypothetical protein
LGEHHLTGKRALATPWRREAVMAKKKKDKKKDKKKKKGKKK